MTSFDTYHLTKDWQGDFCFDQAEAQVFAGELNGFDLRGARVLELGFGNGAFMAWAHSQGSKVCGVELNGFMTERAEAQGFEAHHGDLADIGALAGRQFDLIVAYDVFEHVAGDRLPQMLSVIHSRLADGGHLLARFPNGQSPFGRIFQYADATHVSVLSLPSFRQIAEPIGFNFKRGGNAFRPTPSAPVARAFDRIRCLGRNVIEILCARLYGFQRTPFDPNVTILLGLEKAEDESAG